MTPMNAGSPSHTALDYAGCDLAGSNLIEAAAGTGKTYLAMAMAVAAMSKELVRRIVLVRPAVEAGEKLGFLPGDLAEKVNPYLRPLYDALHDMMDYEHASNLIQRGAIEVARAGTSYEVTIAAKAKDPQLVAQIANAVAASIVASL